MRFRFLLLLLLVVSGATAQTITLQQARDRFQLANNGEPLCDLLLKGLSGVTLEKNAVMYGYLGAAETIYAQYSYNPYTKLTRFNAGKDKLEAAVRKQPNSMELHYLRFTVQAGAPSFLGYNTALSADKLFLLNGLSALAITDYDLYRRISGYLNQSTQLTAAEKQRLTAIMTAVPAPKK